jgi:hypothetical protein
MDGESVSDPVKFASSVGALMQKALG